MLALQFGAAFAGLMAAPHCVAMCGALASGVGSAGRETSGKKSAKFALLLGRLISYTIAGGLIGLFSQSFISLLQTSQWLRPLWVLLQCSVMLLGFWVFVAGQLPSQLLGGLQRLGRSISHVNRSSTALTIGLGWGLIPCGVLQSAYLMAMMSGDLFQGALVMFIFALVSSVSLWVGSRLWSGLLMQSQKDPADALRAAELAHDWWRRALLVRIGSEGLLYRITGALMGGLSAWGLYHSLLSLLNPGAGSAGVQCL